MKNGKIQRIQILAAACVTVCCLWGCRGSNRQNSYQEASEAESGSSETVRAIQERSISSNRESTADTGLSLTEHEKAAEREQERQEPSKVYTADSTEENKLKTQQKAAETQKAEKSIDDLTPGSVPDPSEIPEPSACFKSYAITKGDVVWQQINGKSWHENDAIVLSDLRYLKMLHYNFNHQIQVGEMIVNAAIAEDTLQVFRDLFDHEYEIEKMLLVDHFWTGDAGDTDENSIEHNNTSAFNYREITGGGKLSNHALGRAIDVNPQQNPYIYLGSDGNYRWDHENASAYIDRTTGDPHVIVSGDVCQTTFEKYGFSWGGYWHNPKDYQHFEKR